MAENVGKISYLVEIDTKNFSASLKEVDSAVKGASDNTGKSLDSLASKANIAIAATVAAFGAMAGAAVKNYANYEQLAGGVEKLFGKEQAQTIITNANNAFKTAGLSANDYMETATSFSASLIKGLSGDTAKAARLTDVAIRAMSDNVNTFGTDMSSVQYAFQGFAKQNYTMLDNLKLGYGGSAGEMAKLINDSGVLGDTMKVTAETVNNISFDKIIEAIQTIQEQQNIAGTTAKEAATTISGSWSSLTAAFNNVLTGVEGSGQQLSDSVLNMVRQLSEKVPPIVANMVTGMGTAIKTSLDEQFGKGTADIISAIVVSIGTLVGTFVLLSNTIKVATAVQAAYTAISSYLTLVASLQAQGLGLLRAAWLGLNIVMSANPIVLVISAVVALVAGLIWFFTQTETGKKIWADFTNFLGETITNIGNWFIGLRDGAVATFFMLVISAVAALGAGIIWSFTQIETSKKIWDDFTKFLGETITNIGNWFKGLWDGIVATFSGIGQWFGNRVNEIKNFFSIIPSAIGGFFNDAWNRVTGLWNGIGSWFSGLGGQMVGAGKNMIDGLVKGISDGKDAVINKIKEIASGSLDAIKKFFGIKSPSRVMAQIGQYIMQGWSIGMDRSADLAISSAQRASSGILGTFDNLTSPTLGIDGSGALSGSYGSRTANIINNYVVNNQADAEIISRKQAYAMGAV